MLKARVGIEMCPISVSSTKENRLRIDAFWESVLLFSDLGLDLFMLKQLIYLGYVWLKFSFRAGAC